MPKGNYIPFFIIPYLICLLGKYLLENSQPRTWEAYRTKYTLKHFPAPKFSKMCKYHKQKKNQEKSAPQGSHNVL